MSRSTWVAVKETVAESARHKAIASEDGLASSDWRAAAVLWFDSLDRIDQAIMLRKTFIRIKPHSTRINREAEKITRNRVYPIHSSADVLRAAIVGFAELPKNEREQWVLELTAGLVG
jgi:hypothetical protein